MSHNLSGEHFVAQNRPGWHRLGITVTERLCATAAVEVAGGNYELELRQLFADVDGLHVPAPDMYAIVRGAMPPAGDRPQRPEELAPAVLGTCSRKYNVISNLELAAILDPLTERYPVDTFGVLDNGAQVFFCLRAQEDSEVNGEEIHNYFTVTDSKIPGHTARVFYSPVRVVCQNTLTQGVNAATIMFTVRHRRQVRDDFQFHTNLMTRMAGEQEATLEAFRRMASTPIPAPVAKEIIAETFPTPPVPSHATTARIAELARLDGEGIAGAAAQLARAADSHQQWEHRCERIASHRASAGLLLERFNDSHPRSAGTVWAVYNACTELSDWRPGRGNIARSILFGARADEKARAYRVCLDHISRN